MVPLALGAAVLMCFVKQKPLATAIEHDVLSESLSEGHILITADVSDDEALVSASRPRHSTAGR